MQTREETFTSRADGLIIHVLITEPEGEPRGMVQFAHGMAEHKARYLPLMTALSEQGYLCALNDHRGHGRSVRSDDDLGHFTADALVDDMIQLSEQLREEHEHVPLFLFGHSMGSLAARCYLKRAEVPLNGLILCGSPSDNPGAKPGLMLIALIGAIKGDKHRSGMMDSLVNGGNIKRFPGEGSDFSWLNTDRKQVAKYEQDPLCGFRFTLTGYRALLSMIVDTYSGNGWQVKQPDLPVLFISGADDPCMIDETKFNQAIQHLKQRGYHRVQSKTYPGMRHEIMHEPGSDQVTRDILDFLNNTI